MRKLFNSFCFVLLFAWVSGGKVKADEAAPSFRLSPSRLTLGGLSYGSSRGETLLKKVTLTTQDPSAKVSVTKVDLSQAPGIRLKEQKSEPGKVEILFEVDTAAFTQGQPFGKFLKALIRLETDSERFPQVVIPVIAWLSVNETSRNFNDFQFRGSQRWQGPWATPNMAGAVLVPFILLTIGGLGWSCNVVSGQRPDPQHAKASQPRILKGLAVVGLVLIGAIALWLLYLLGHTYSRGSWIALAAGLSVLMLQPRGLRWFAVGASAFFLILIVTLPAGVDRVGSYAHMEGDKSIGNRFKLWTGALQIMAEHPLRGIGADNYGTVFRRDYQVFEHKEGNSTAVSDFMTFGAERGLLFAGLASGLLLLLSVEALRSREKAALVLGAMLVSMLVASAFSTLWFVRHYQVLFGFSVIGLFFLLMRRVWFSENRKHAFKKLLQKISMFTVSSLLVWMVLAWIGLRSLPTRSMPFPGEVPTGSGAWMVEPRSSVPLGTILYLGEAKEELSFLSQTTLRPLAAWGWRVVWPGPIEQEEQLPAWVQRLEERYPGETIYVAGHGRGGTLAWKLMSQPGQKIRAGAGCGFLTEDLGQGMEGQKMKPPFLVYQSLYDDQVQANTAIRAQKGLAFVGLPLKVVLKSEIFGRFSEAWLEWIQAVHEHFSAKPPG